MRQKLYVESTVWYQLVNYASSGFKDRAEEMFYLIEKGNYEIYISNIVLEEIALNNRKYRERLFSLIKKYKPVVIFQDKDIELLADAYTEHAFKGIHKQDILCDAFHAAIATAANINYMVSYNYRYLLNIGIQEHMKSINLFAGYTHSCMILPPFMFLKFDAYSGETGSVDKLVWEIKRAYGEKLTELAKKTEAKRFSFHRIFTNRAIRKLGLKTITVTPRASSHVIL
jgi:predicted nucleic acid-binding protein